MIQKLAHEQNSLTNVAIHFGISLQAIQDRLKHDPELYSDYYDHLVKGRRFITQNILGIAKHAGRPVDENGNPCGRPDVHGQMRALEWASMQFLGHTKVSKTDTTLKGDKDSPLHVVSDWTDIMKLAAKGLEEEKGKQDGERIEDTEEGSVEDLADFGSEDS